MAATGGGDPIRCQYNANVAEQLNPRQLNLIFLLIVILCTRYITPKAKNTAKTKLKAKTLKKAIFAAKEYADAGAVEEWRIRVSFRHLKRRFSGN